MGKVLLAVGLQKAKRAGNEKKFDMICNYFDSHAGEYNLAVNIVRVKNHMNHNSSSKDDIINKGDKVNACVMQGITHELHGFTLNNPEMFPMQHEYYIIGGSLSFAILALAFQMYGAGYNVKVLSKYTFDRKGTDKEAEKIFKAYMPDVLI